VQKGACEKIYTVRRAEMEKIDSGVFTAKVLDGEFPCVVVVWGVG